jgi:hypothetical protein
MFSSTYDTASACTRTWPATVVSWVLGIARGLMALGLVLVMLVVGIMLVVPRFAPVPVEWEVSASWLGVGTHMTIPVRFYIDTDFTTPPSVFAAGTRLDEDQALTI